MTRSLAVREGRTASLERVGERDLVAQFAALDGVVGLHAMGFKFKYSGFFNC